MRGEGKREEGGEKLARGRGRGGRFIEFLFSLLPCFLALLSPSNLLHMFRIFLGGKCVKGEHRERVDTRRIHCLVPSINDTPPPPFSVKGTVAKQPKTILKLK